MVNRLRFPQKSCRVTRRTFSSMFPLMRRPWSLCFRWSCTLSLKRTAYFAILRLMGRSLPETYNGFYREDAAGLGLEKTTQLLGGLLSHCRQHVPYYAQILGQGSSSQ